LNSVPFSDRIQISFLLVTSGPLPPRARAFPLRVCRDFLASVFSHHMTTFHFPIRGRFPAEIFVTMDFPPGRRPFLSMRIVRQFCLLTVAFKRQSTGTPLLFFGRYTPLRRGRRELCVGALPSESSPYAIFSGVCLNVVVIKFLKWSSFPLPPSREGLSAALAE